jgi:hypothetical protein
VTVSGAGFPAGESVFVIVGRSQSESATAPLEHAQVGTDGTVRLTFVMPEDAVRTLMRPNGLRDPCLAVVIRLGASDGAAWVIQLID